MALADPQVLPGTPTIELDAVGSTVGTYRSDDLTYTLNVTHQRSGNGRSRHIPKLTLVKIASDPLLPSQNREYSVSVHLVIDAPAQGFTATEIEALYDRFADYLQTAGLGLKLIQGQA